MARRKKNKSLPGVESPETAVHPGLPPAGNVGRCRKCKRMIDACLIEISRNMPTSGIVYRRAYACRTHAAEVAVELVKDLTSWTSWSDLDDDQPEKDAEQPAPAEQEAGPDGG